MKPMICLKIRKNGSRSMLSERPICLSVKTRWIHYLALKPGKLNWVSDKPVFETGGN